MNMERVPKAIQEESIYDDGGVWMKGSLLGKGSYGSVHLAGFPSKTPRYDSLPAVVAVKSADYSTLEELAREKVIYDQLRHSPFLIRCFGDDVTASSDTGFLHYNVFLEYASGGALWDLIRKSNGLGLLESQAKAFTRSLLGGIDHIHRAGFAHCDLKPENVLLVRSQTDRRDLVAKIGDLGLAKNVTDNSNIGVRGTFMYLAPECFLLNIQGQDADIWALGCIVFSMLTGDLNWDIAPDIWKLADPSRRISKEAEDFVRKCLSKNPYHRPTAAMLLSHPFVAKPREGRTADHTSTCDAIERLVGLLSL